MAKQELAVCAGASVKKLKSWLKPHQELFWNIGMSSGRGYLPPNVVNGLSTIFV